MEINHSTANENVSFDLPKTDNPRYPGAFDIRMTKPDPLKIAGLLDAIDPVLRTTRHPAIVSMPRMNEGGRDYYSLSVLNIERSHGGGHYVVTIQINPLPETYRMLLYTPTMGNFASYINHWFVLENELDPSINAITEEDYISEGELLIRHHLAHNTAWGFRVVMPEGALFQPDVDGRSVSMIVHLLSGRGSIRVRVHLRMVPTEVGETADGFSLFKTSLLARRLDDD